MSKKRKKSKQVEDAEFIGIMLNHRACIFKDRLKRFVYCGDREFLKNRIHRAVIDKGFSLSERAWKNIDKEDRLPILKALFFLCLPLLDDFGEDLRPIRNFLLENKRYWKYIALENTDDWYLTRSERNARNFARFEGRRQEKLEMARKMKKDRVPVDKITEYSGLPKEEIEKL